MRSGAADYVPKERLDANLLERSIRYAIERRRNEEDLRRMRDGLEVRVRERTAELARALEVLQAEVAERTRAEEQLKASLREKEVLLREIHHRVKNNLQIISSLLNLQSKQVKDKQALEMFKESQHRVRTMALIHEKLYRSRDLARVHFAEYLHGLAAHLFRAYGVNPEDVRLEVEGGGAQLGIDTVIPCALLTHELISNALVHAFPQGKGELHVELKPEGAGRHTLTVIDNGVGLPADLDWRASKSLGLQLVNALADQLDGRVEVTSRPGWTSFQITFAELKYNDRR
jgi:two-component sensor histidine kinase